MLTIGELAGAAGPEQVLADEKWKIFEILVDHVIACNYAGVTANTTSSEIPEESARESLSKGLNSPCIASKSLWALEIAHRILKSSENLLPESLPSILSFYLVWQHLLVDPEAEIKEEVLPIMEKLNQQLPNLSTDQKTQILLQMAAIHFQYFEYDNADALIQKASEECELNVDLTGMMGIRTRFQKREIAQLVLVHKDPSLATSPAQPSDTDIPQNCDLNDDTLLEQVSTTESGHRVDGRTLTAPQLCCLLWIARHEAATHRHDVFVHERCTPFIDTVVSARRGWAVQAAALLLRAELEKGKGRHVDRSCVQSELVVKLQQGIDDPVQEKSLRTSYALSSGLLPFWQSSILLTEILKSLGCTSEALLILEKLELWDGVVECYKQLGQLEKAETLIRRLIEQKPGDSMLYVFLGDITRNADYFLKAIEISADRNARAHRSLGHVLLMDKKYEEAYGHLRRSLELQPIQLGTWFNAGYCAWKLENFKESTQCYHRCVSLQPDHFEAWNNLSAAYIRLGNKEKAWKLLQEALKFNYEHPNVWENFMLLSVDVGEFSSAISSYHRLLDMNKRGADDEVLELIGTEILGVGSAENGEIKEEMVKLLARISAAHQTLSSKTLRIYAQLKKPSTLSQETRTEFEKYVQLLEKSLASANGKANWPRDEKLAVNVLETAVLLAENRLELAKFINSESSVREASAKIRLSMRGIVQRLEKDAGNREKSEEYSERLLILENEARRVLDLVAI